MLLVNFLGGYQAVHAILKHHNTYCSYADTIMPQFFFAVGFAYRLTFLRRVANRRLPAGGGRGPPAEPRADPRRASSSTTSTARSPDWDELKAWAPPNSWRRPSSRELFQALVHIALTSIWVLPVIAAGTGPRCCSCSRPRACTSGSRGGSTSIGRGTARSSTAARSVS